MARLQGFKRIEGDMFPQEMRRIGEAIGYSVNVFADEVLNAFDHNITMNNLNQSISQFTTIVDSNGIPKIDLILNISVSGLQGLHVIRAENLSDTTNLTGSPFLTYNLVGSGNKLQITHITGIPADKEYRFTVHFIGN